MISKLEAAGATKVIQTGASWFEADQFLRNELLPKAKAEGENPVYVPPFDHPAIWEGNSTLIHEVVRQLPSVDQHYPSIVDGGRPGTIDGGLKLPDAIICSVGGGGLFNGIMQGLGRYSHPTKKDFTKVLAMETIGADSLYQSVQEGKLVTLPKITSVATTLGARTVSEQAFKYASEEKRVTCAVLTDKETVQACKQFADDERILVEPACAVSLAVLYTGKLKQFLPNLRPESRVVVVVCGGSGLSLDILNKYIEDYLG